MNPGDSGEDPPVAPAAERVRLPPGRSPGQLGRFAILAGLMLTALSLLPITAAAQSPDELMQEGLELRRQQRDEEALERFQRAYEIARSGQALAQMALAEQALGRYVDAEAHLVAAIGTAMDPWIATRRAQLQEALDQIRAQLGTIEISGGIPGAEVHVNGVPRGTLPEASTLRARAGSAAIEVRAQGYLTVQRQVMVPAGGTARETIQMVAAANQPAVGPTPIASDPTSTAPPPGTAPLGQQWPNAQPEPVRYETQPRWGLFVAGTIMFAVPWIATWATGLAVDEGDLTGFSFIPIAGPFVIIGTASWDFFDGFMFGTLLVLDGLLQAAGAIMAIIGVASQTQVEVRASLGPGDRAPQIALEPIGVPGGAGLGVTLTHF